MGQYLSQLCKEKKNTTSKVQQQKSQQVTIIHDNADDYDSDPTEQITVTKKELNIVNWKRGNFLGQGYFSMVYQGFDKNSGRVFAVKQIEISLIDKESLKAFNKEIAILNQLSHRNIIEYYGSHQNGPQLCIFLEYGGGGSIAQIIKKFGTLSESVVQRYTTDILQGLIYLHKKSIIHRDIKGANILVDTQGVCKLADFGCSLIGVQANSLKGTPNWMAPEVLHQREIGRQSDIWSLGCLIIEMITGQPPWGRFENSIQALFKISSKNCPPPIPENISDNLKNFLNCCLQMEPKNRWKAKELQYHPFILLKSPKKSLKSTRRNTNQTDETKKQTQFEEQKIQKEDLILTELSSLYISDEKQKF